MIPRLNAAVFLHVHSAFASIHPVLGADGVTTVRLCPGVLDTLDELLGLGTRLGLLGALPGAIRGGSFDVAPDELLARFRPQLIVRGRALGSLIDKASRRALADLAEEDDAGPTPVLLLVSDDVAARAQARAKGFETAPHPALAASVLLRRGPLRYLRIRVPPAAVGGPWREALQAQPRLVPLHVSLEPGGGAPTPVVYAISDAPTAAILDDLGFWVDRLGVEDEPQFTEPYLLCDDLQAETGPLVPAGNSSAFFSGAQAAGRVLASTHEGLLVALPAGESLDRYHFVGTRHGHTRRLSSASGLLHAGSGIAWMDVAGATLPMRPLDPGEEKILREEVKKEALETDVARYSGAPPLNISSRHIRHADNDKAARALAASLDEMGLTVDARHFPHQLEDLLNVAAVLAGQENDDGEVPEGVVLVTAHLDSTASESKPYSEKDDPAPGADDDASGIAGVLASARAIIRLAKAFPGPRREIRFVLFNSEEEGKEGSDRYAEEQRCARTPIVGVFQMDMIGTPPPAGERNWEVHGGWVLDPEVQRRSIALAKRVSAMAQIVSRELPAPQLYPLREGARDPAEDRSDHYNFLRRGYPACKICEDFYPGPGRSPGEPSKHYHKDSDVVAFIDPAYAAGIARAVAAAAWITATR